MQHEGVLFCKCGFGLINQQMLAQLTDMVWCTCDVESMSPVGVCVLMLMLDMMMRRQLFLESISGERAKGRDGRPHSSKG